MTGITTAARSRDAMRKLGYDAEVVEHRRGRFIRVDLFGYADVIAYNGQEIILIQAYHKKEEKKHKHLDITDPKIMKWLLSGGKFEHHLWYFNQKKGIKYWGFRRKPIDSHLNPCKNNSYLGSNATIER